MLKCINVDKKNVAFLTLLLICFLSRPQVARGDANSVRNGGFEEGLENWTVEQAKDYAQVKVVDDAFAPDGTKSLLFNHTRTRTSTVKRTFKLAPCSVYVLSFWIRAEDYLRTGQGMWLRVWGGGQEFGGAYMETELQESWQIKHIPVAAGSNGEITLELILHNSTGKIWIDNVKLTQTTPQEARKIVGNVPIVPKIPVPQGKAACNVIFDEIPISLKVPSTITFQAQWNMEDQIRENTGRLQLELPCQIELYQQAGQKENIGNGYCRYTFSGKDFAKAYANYYHFSIRLISKTPVSDNSKAKCWLEWEGGRQEPREVKIVFLNIPNVSQPREIITGTGAYQTDNYPDYFNMIQSLGFNTIDMWGGGSQYIKEYRAHNIDVDTIHDGFCAVSLVNLLARVKDARSLAFDGTKKDSVIDASHRGEVFEAFLAEMEKLASTGYSCLMFDDEHYSAYSSADTCVCDRCKGRWKQWLNENRPELEAIMPEVFLDDPLNYQQQYNAWWFFRAALVKEWYAAARERFMNSVKKYDSDSGKTAWVSSFTGPIYMDEKTTFMNAADMVGVFDRIMPMWYEDGFAIRKHIPQLLRAVRPKYAYAALCMGDGSGTRWQWQPGDIKAQILELLFGGGKGYMFWGWHYTNLRIIAEIAQTNGVVADNEEIFLHGKSTDRFWTEQDKRFAATLETPDAGLLLVSSYTQTDNDKVWVRKRPEEAMTLTELYDGRKIKLSKDQQIFSVEVSPGNCSLWKYQK